MIKFNKDDISYTSKQGDDGAIITMLDDNQFYVLEIEINKNIQIKCITPMASNQNDYKVVINKTNLFSSLLSYLFNNYPTLTDSLNPKKYLRITKDFNDDFILEMSKESCHEDDLFYGITIYPKKIAIDGLIDEVNKLQNNLVLASDNNNTIKRPSGITKTLYRKAV